MNKERKSNPNPNSIIIQECQLGEYLNIGKTMWTQWIKDGRLRHFKEKKGGTGTRFFIVEHIAQDMVGMYNTYWNDDKYDIGER